MSRGIQVTSRSPEQTREIGECVGQVLAGGHLIALCGDLGAGKTNFTQGLARGLGVAADEPVVSPTFVLVREYLGRLRLLHLDAYRLTSFREMLDIGLEEMISSSAAVIVIEWADRFPELIALSNIRVDLRHISESDRGIAISGQEPIVRTIHAVLRTIAEGAPGMPQR